jgi:hypothetical protein
MASFLTGKDLYLYVFSYQLTAMKTYPIARPDGSLCGFEITSNWLTLRPLLRLLRSVTDVTDVRRKWFSDTPVTFKYQGNLAVVYEPWGDSSRYWIGLQDPDGSPQIDISPIRDAFLHYDGFRL